jgi:subtilase family serine protease
VSTLSAPGTAALGSTISVTDTTKNQGAGPAADASTGFYLSVNSVLDATDVFLGARSLGALAPGVTSSTTTSLPLPAGTAAGEYYVVAKADWAGAVPEGDESNNTRLASLRIGPDLAVTALTAPSSAPAGGSLVVSDTTKNQGPEAVPITTTRFYLSTNSSLSADDVLLGGRMVGALAAGANEIGSTTLAIPAGVAPGNYTVIAVADGGGAVAEAVESNNTRTRGVSITASGS